jgi:hypothetical protein
MNDIEKQAAFYRGYLTDERSLVPLTIVLASVVALWLLVYLVAAVAEVRQDAGAWRAAPSPSVTVPLRACRSGATPPLPGRSFRPTAWQCRRATNPATNLLLISL